MQYFNFERLIEKYSSEFSLIVPTEGAYDENGDWVKSGEEKIALKGAVISSKDFKSYRSDGTLSEKDKVLFMLAPIKNDLAGSKVLYDGDVYSINDRTENYKFTGVYCYTLKFVSAFKETSGSQDITEDVERLQNRLDGENGND